MEFRTETEVSCNKYRMLKALKVSKHNCEYWKKRQSSVKQQKREEARK